MDREVHNFRHAGTIEELLSRVASTLGVPVVVHWDYLTEMSIRRSRRTPALHLQSTNGRGLLAVTLRELGQGEVCLGMWCEDGTLHVSTREHADRAPFSAAFDVSRFIMMLDPDGDFAHLRDGGDPNEIDVAAQFVIDTVTLFADFESWQVNGGYGIADAIGTTLHVRNGRTAIRSVVELLDTLHSSGSSVQEIARIVPHFMHDEHRVSRRVARRLAASIGAPAFEDATVTELLAWFADRTGIVPYVEWSQLEALSIEPTQRVTMPAMPGVAAFAWLECALDAISDHETWLSFSVRDGILCVSTMESIGSDANSLLVDDVSPILCGFDGSEMMPQIRPKWRTRYALELLTEMLSLHVQFEDWMVNGGKGKISGFLGRLIVQNSAPAIVGVRAALAKIAAAEVALERGGFEVLRDWGDDARRDWNARVIERLEQRAFPTAVGEMPLRHALANLSAEAEVAIWLDDWDRTLGEGGRERLLRARVYVAPAVRTFRERLEALLRQVPPLDRNPVTHIRGGVIVVSREMSVRHLIFRAYPLGKLFRDAHNPGAWPILFGSNASDRARDDASFVEVDPNNPYEAIGEHIRDWLIELTGPSRWNKHGGRSAISVFGDVLLVTSDAWTHDTIEAALRAAHAKLRVIPPQPRPNGR